MQASQNLEVRGHRESVFSGKKGENRRSDFDRIKTT